MIISSTTKIKIRLSGGDIYEYFEGMPDSAVGDRLEFEETPLNGPLRVPRGLSQVLASPMSETTCLFWMTRPQLVSPLLGRLDGA